MSDLNDLVEPLKRELAVPGEFDTRFPNTGDGDLADSLADAFAEAQLYGYFADNALDLDTYLVDPDISMAGGYLVVTYAGMRIIRAQLRALTLSEKYAAGSASYEVTRSATVLKEELLYLQKRAEDLITKASGTDTFVIDAYFTRQLSDWSSGWGLYPSELG